MELVLDVINQFMSAWKVREVLLSVLESMFVIEKLAYSSILLIRNADEYHIFWNELSQFMLLVLG